MGGAETFRNGAPVPTPTQGSPLGHITVPTSDVLAVVSELKALRSRAELHACGEATPKGHPGLP